MLVDVLIVDDEPDIRNILASVLQDAGYSTRQAKNSQETLLLVHEKKPGVVVLDVWLNNSALDGIQTLEEIKKIYQDVPIILMSGHGTVDMAVSATKKGAYDFITKPFKTDALLNTIYRAMDAGKLKSQNVTLQTRLGIGDRTLIGESKEIVSIRKRLTALSKMQVPVLIVGAMGTGKDIAAHSLHDPSMRSGHYITFNAVDSDRDAEGVLFGTMNPRKSGALEEASAGSIFIDNMDVLPIKQQLQLQRSISQGCFFPVGSSKSIALSARIIVATRTVNRLHPDLLVRFQHSTITMPTLIERIGDIEILAKSFMLYRSKARGCQPLRFSTNAITALSLHNWKYNMWELINVIDRILSRAERSVVSKEIVKAALSVHEDRNPVSMEHMLMLSLREARELFERFYISFHLRRFNDNIKQTAAFVRMDRSALSRKVKTLALQGERRDPDVGDGV